MKKTILQFEDEKLLANMYGAKLTNLGFNHIWKEHPPAKREDLINYVAETKPDLIMMNIIMPVMDGFRATEILKRDPRTKSIPIFIFTNMSQKEDIRQGIYLGADDYFVIAQYTPSQLTNKIIEYFDNPKNYQPEYKKYIKNTKGYKKDCENRKFREILYIALSAFRPMPAYFTSDYNKQTGEYTKSKTFGAIFEDISAHDEYEMSSFCYHKIPNSDLLKRGKQFFYAILIIGEDLCLASFIAARQEYKKIIPRLKKAIIDTHLKTFEDNRFPSEEIISDKIIMDYFNECIKFALEREKNHDKSKECKTGLSLTDNDHKLYRTLRLGSQINNNKDKIMKKPNKRIVFSVSAIIILILIGIIIFWGIHKDNTKIYYVHKISEHTPHSETNSYAKLEVYVNGKDGHTQSLYCYFPPNTKFNCEKALPEPENFYNCTGLNKIKRLGIEGKFLSDYAYYCEVIN